MGISVPREKITWFPTINYDACIGDRVCFEFCHNDVFVWDEENQLPIVQNPLNCVVGCESCAQLCPSEAITFPSKEELRTTLRRLREEKKNTGETAQPVSSGSGQPEMAGER
jgi:NAD-dependent dihydropyrimidine dehydrogenase PreA subunit